MIFLAGGKGDGYAEGSQVKKGGRVREQFLGRRTAALGNNFNRAGAGVRGKLETV